MRKRILLLLGAAAVVAAVVALVRLGRAKPQSAPYLTAEVDRGTVVQSVTTTGTITAVTTVKVGSQVSGIIATLHADFNDRVRKEQVLATLDPTPFQASVEQARAQLDRTRVAASDAEAKLRRQRALFEAALTSEDQLDSAKAAFDQAQAQVTELQAALQRSETNLRYSIIRSPIDGVVVSRDYDVGQTVAASFQAPTLFTIAEDLTRMQLTCQVDEADIGQIKVGQAVRFSVDSFPERDFTGTVSQIRLAPQLVSNVVTYPVIVQVGNADLVLLPGMTAEVRVEVAEARDVLRVPASATRFRPELIGREGGAASAATRPSAGQRPNGDRQQGRTTNGAGERGQLRVFLAPEDPAGALTPVLFKGGLTDGQFIEVRQGDIGEGQRIVVGVATAASQEAGGLAGMAPIPGRRR